MSTLQQGENLTEQPITDSNGAAPQLDDSPAKASEETTNDKKFNLSPKTIGIGAAVVILLVGGIILFSPKSGTNSSEIMTNNEQPVHGYQQPVQTQQVEQPAQTQDNSVNEYGEPLVVGSADTVQNPYKYLAYTEEEVLWLREAGYTGDEIEYYSQQGTDANTLISESDNARLAKNQEWYDSVTNSASDAYKNLESKTFVGSKDTSNSHLTAETVKKFNTIKENVDYHKSGVYGYQAWLKIESPSLGPLLMYIPLPRYNELAESGNIVISYTAYYTDMDNKNLAYIVDLKEITI